MCAGIKSSTQPREVWGGLEEEEEGPKEKAALSQNLAGWCFQPK